ncbi:hypothetical protein INT46_003334 [Mucor plumbeus]|uniref:Uncharacterized protein n=1 Tax=Mucor plumbeus TaxID=97098 RepID=A0A8H7R3B8_9FUNG|nr:hypothetical protein INT46_003334 [Mucor plumbeus]
MNRTNTSSVNITRSEFQSLLNEVKALKTAVDQLASKSLILELIQLISPLFPQDINLYNASNDIEEAAQNAQQSAIANPANSNLRGNRYIPTTLAGTKQKTSTRIKTLLKCLHTDSSDNCATIDESSIKDTYEDLKKLACRERNDAIAADLSIKTMSWKDLKGYNPSKHGQLKLNLESKAFLLYKVKLHLCQESWGADRLMFEAFRGGSKGKKRRFTNQNDVAERFLIDMSASQLDAISSLETEHNFSNNVNNEDNQQEEDPIPQKRSRRSKRQNTTR